LQDFTVLAQDGKIGLVDEFYFDDKTWTIRYLVVDTGSWLLGRQVLISPAAFAGPDWEQETFKLKITKEQVENSPDVDTTQPISRRQEAKLLAYYGWPAYWSGSGILLNPGIGVRPNVNRAAEESDKAETVDDSHLRSTKAVLSYHIQARDGEAGHLEDFIIDDEKWTIDYMVVDTRNWLPGKKVTIAPYWVKTVSWPHAKVYVDLSQETIKNSPEYDPSALID